MSELKFSPTITTTSEAPRMPLSHSSEIEFRYALEIGKYHPKVGNNFLGGERSGVNGTPTFFISNQRHIGPFDIETLSSAIGGHLVQAKLSQSVRIPVRPG